MKKNPFKLVVICLITVILLGCSEKVDLSQPDLIGKWKWIQTTGGFAGVNITPETEGFTRTLVFSEDGHYKFIKNDSVTEEGTYEIIKKKNTIAGEAFVISYSGGRLLEEIIVQQNDTLNLQQNVIDGFRNKYTRVK